MITFNFTLSSCSVSSVEQTEKSLIQLERVSEKSIYHCHSAAYRWRRISDEEEEKSDAAFKRVDGYYRLALL